MIVWGEPLILAVGYEAVDCVRAGGMGALVFPVAHGSLDFPCPQHHSALQRAGTEAENPVTQAGHATDSRLQVPSVISPFSGHGAMPLSWVRK